MGALNDLIDDFLASLDVEKGYSRNTLDAYARDLADFSAFLEEKGLADISRVDAESVSLFNQRLRSKGVSQNTVARKVACIRSFMKFAFRDSARGSQAVEDVERPRVRRGLPRALPENEVARVIDAMNAAGIKTSLFIDPDPEQITMAARLQAPWIELHTGAYANHYHDAGRAAEFARLVAGAKLAHAAGLVANAGHGINYTNITEVRTIPHLHELNIGHSIISRALATGIDEAVRAMKALMNP